MTNRKKLGTYEDEADYLSEFEVDLNEDEPLAFFQFIYAAMDRFQLGSAARVNFVARCVTKCLQLGAVPCVPGGPDYDHDWVSTAKYGTKPADILRNVMEEWIADGAQRLEPWTGPFFGLPKDVVPLEKAIRMARR